MTLTSGGTTFKVNPSGADIVNFDPTRDLLDFGDISVHGLILGKLDDGSAIIVNPWGIDDYQRILDSDGNALRWDQLTLENFAPVGNEHLRADIGGVLSWEQGVGPINSEDTVYIRSHEYGAYERIEGFDPSTDKLNFIYLGTRERISAIDTDEGLLISTQPSNQTTLLVGVKGSELIGQNLEFHFDQIEEDNLETVFGFQAKDLTLVDRTLLLTPPAPEGATTDGYQTRLGSTERSSGVMATSQLPMEHNHTNHSAMPLDDMSGSMNQSSLDISASGNLYWGGMSGQINITNTGSKDLDDWQITFDTPHAAFQSWAGDANVEQLANGSYRITLTPASWNQTIAAGSTIAIAFNAESSGLPNSGQLTDELFFSTLPDSLEMVEPDLTPLPDTRETIEAAQQEDSLAPTNNQPTVEPTNETVTTLEVGAEGSTENLSLSATGNLYWGGMSGELLIKNDGEEAVEGWEITFETPHSNFQSWAGDAQIEKLANGNYQVTLSPAAWNQRIGSGESISIGFNAATSGLPTSGLLTNQLFFAGEEQQNITLPANTISEPATGSQEQEATVNQVEMLPKQQAVDSEKRVVGYFEEWGIYSRDFMVQDINVEDLTHINYSFFDVKANGDVILFDQWAATDRRFSQTEQVSRTFSASHWVELGEEQRSVFESSGRFTTQLNPDGTVKVTGQPVGWDSTDRLAGNLGQLQLLKELYPTINLGMALGGWTLSDEFSLALDDPEGREAFTSNIITTLERYDFFTTIDFDWEYPGGGGLSTNASSPNDGTYLASTLEILRQKLDGLSLTTGETYEISIATAGGADKLANLNLRGIDPYVDFYNVMAYDFHGGWESNTGHQAAMTGDAGGYDVLTAIDQFRSNDVQLDKIVLGAPAYTRAWGNVEAGTTFGYGESGEANAAQGSFEAGNYDHKDIITGISDGTYDLIWDDYAKAAFAYDPIGKVWTSAETTATIAGKAAYVNEAGLGGMMFWALSNDDPGEQSLIGAASDVLMGTASADDVAQRSPAFDAVLGGDGGFSISDFTGLA